MKRWLLNPEVRDVWGKADEAALLAAYERVWERKSILRRLYETWFRMIFDELRPGSILEVAAGTGNFKRWLQGRGRSCWSMDILRGKYMDVQGDALRLPFREGSVDNIVLLDALHHFARPLEFFRQAGQILRPGGRVLLVEPFVSGWGRVVYRYFHHERVDFSFQETDGVKQAWDGNAAIPQLVLSKKNRHRIPLQIQKLSFCEFLAYPLSGGFSYRSLLPGPLLLMLHKLEQTPVFQNKLVSLRIFAILEKGTCYDLSKT